MSLGICLVCLVSCNFKYNDKSNNQVKYTKEANVNNDIFDTLIYKTWSNKKVCIGKRLFPIQKVDIHTTIQTAKKSGVSLILQKNIDSTVIVVNQEWIFNSFIDSIMNTITSNAYISTNKYRVEDLEEPIGAKFYGNGCDSIIMINNIIEYCHLCEDSPIIVQFLGDSKSINEFLLSHSISVKQKILSNRILLINVHEVSGSWFNTIVEQYVKPLEFSINESILYHYDFELIDNRIVGLDINLIIIY